jgi:hypothetical protein
MALQNLESLSVFGINVPKNGIILKKINGAAALEVPLPSLNLRGVNDRFVGVEGPRYIWPGFRFELPLENAVQTIALALKNCI